jgi:hypothetical protein
MTLNDMTPAEKQIAEQARRDAVQACVLLVSMQFGDRAGKWLRAELFRIAPDEGGLGEPARANAPLRRRKFHSTGALSGSHVG